jgi:hypothetical protein
MAALTVREMMALEKRVPGAVWRWRAATGAFCMANEEELMCHKGDGWRRNDWQLLFLIWAIEERRWPVGC